MHVGHSRTCLMVPMTRSKLSLKLVSAPDLWSYFCKPPSLAFFPYPEFCYGFSSTLTAFIGWVGYYYIYTRRMFNSSFMVFEFSCFCVVYFVQAKLKNMDILFVSSFTFIHK